MSIIIIDMHYSIMKSMHIEKVITYDADKLLGSLLSRAVAIFSAWVSVVGKPCMQTYSFI